MSDQECHSSSEPAWQSCALFTLSLCVAMGAAGTGEVTLPEAEEQFWAAVSDSFFLGFGW